MLAHAKINWTLGIAGTRPDGYHLLDTVMQSIALCDALSISVGPSWWIRCRNLALENEQNLALRAARAVTAAAGAKDIYRIGLKKRIPMGAGLGGGSADAAAVIRFLGEKYGLSAGRQREIAVSLGADIPFLLGGGSAICTGIGEEIEPLALPSYPLLLIKPCEGLSTREIYALYDQMPGERLAIDNRRIARAIAEGDWATVRALGRNDLAEASKRERPEIGQALDALRGQGARYAQMTGSGACVFGVFDGEAARDEAHLALRGTYAEMWKTETRSGKK